MGRLELIGVVRRYRLMALSGWFDPAEPILYLTSCALRLLKGERLYQFQRQRVWRLWWTTYYDSLTEQARRTMLDVLTVLQKVQEATHES